MTIDLNGILNGQNGLFTLILVAVIVVQVFWFIKKGGISYQGHGITIGKVRENELRIVREEKQYMRSITDATINDIPKEIRDKSFYRCKYVIEEYKNFLETLIEFNHLTKDEVYVNLKEEEGYNIVMALTDDLFFKTPEFKKYMYSLTRRLIYGLVDVRTAYEKMV